ncbi:alpha/beta hydrolase [Archangium gephyra]|nr:alpha/beta hydrolase [Archangium gephyra]
MDLSQPSSIPDLLVANLPRGLVLSVEEALEVGARRAFPVAEDMHKGHRPTVLGQMRHFHMNETFAEALEVSGACPSPLKGNDVVVGRAGILLLGRFNISDGPWYNARRSRSRRVMSKANRAIEHLVHLPLLFEPIPPITAATVFFVGVFNGSMKDSPDRPVSIDIAVPDGEMKSWLFREPVSQFVQRYNAAEPQQDLAVPVLKASTAQKNKESGS